MSFSNLIRFSLILLFSAYKAEAQELILSIKGYDMHTELNWNPYTGSDRFQVWRRAENETDFILLTTTRKLRWIDWTGRTEEKAISYQYFIEALTVPGTVLDSSNVAETAVTPFSDEQFLDMTQEYTFRYFYEYGHPSSGMARERLGSEDVVTTGGTGFGIMALIVGVHRGLISREQGVDRLLKIVSFLQFADRFHGAFPHWMNGKTGDVIPFSTYDNGGDLVETAFLMQGLLCARQYFNQNVEEENVLREVITSLWEDVEWDFYSRNNSGVLYWHWSPNYGWQMNFHVRGYNEALIIYLLAIASPTHPVDASYWQSGWAGSGYVNGHTWYGTKLFVGPPMGGPVFFAHYSFMGFDPRNIKDQYANYFDQNRNHTMINRSWCIDNPFNHEGYSENCWGLTASDDPWGYQAHAPGSSADNGTITPAAAIPSMPYTPVECMAALKHFYQQYGENLWGEYGFLDAFNLEENWFASSYLAIDQGPIINMIENYRSGLLWSAFMSNPEIAPALSAIGFKEDLVAVSVPEQPAEWKVYPTLSDGDIYLEFPATLSHDKDIQVVDVLGRLIPAHTKMIHDHLYMISLSQRNYKPGWIWVTIRDKNGLPEARPVYTR